MFRILSLFICAASLPHPGICSVPSSGFDPTPARVLAGELVKALNSKNSSEIREFVNKHVLPNAQIDQRVSRWTDLASQGAPFKIVRDLKQTDSTIDVILVDKNGARIDLTVHFESSPTAMISGIQLAPAIVVEGSPPELRGWKDLRSLAKLILSDYHSPGVGIATIRNGVPQVAVAGYRGVNGKDAVTPDDIWSIGSIGKPICSTVIGLLIEQGKLRWDETLKQALPGVQMDPGFSQVTLEQIMQNRGGMPEDLAFRRSEVDRIAGKAKTPVEVRELYMRDILGRKPIAAPGTRFVYSNSGYALLAHIAEQVTGKPYESLVRQMVFKPLGMTHSYTNADTLPKARPAGHIDGPSGLEAAEMTGKIEWMFAGAGGGIFMSVGDLAKFGEAHLAGLNGHDGLMRAATVARLHRGLPEGPRGERLYACGWGIETLPGVEPFHGHNGSNGTMRAQLAIFPKASLVVVGIVNRGGEDVPAPGMAAVLAIAERYAPK